MTIARKSVNQRNWPAFSLYIMGKTEQKIILVTSMKSKALLESTLLQHGLQDLFLVGETGPSPQSLDNVRFKDAFLLIVDFDHLPAFANASSSWNPTTNWWVFGKDNDSRAAVESMQAGATEYFVPELHDSEIVTRLQTALPIAPQASVIFPEYLKKARVIIATFDDNQGLISELGFDLLQASNPSFGKSPEELLSNYPSLLTSIEKARQGEESITSIQVGNNLYDFKVFKVEDREVSSGLCLVGFNNTQRDRIQKDLLKAKKEVERVAQMKEEFLANMSHEIRTPMNAIIGFTDILQSSQLDENQQHYINSIKRASENLLVILNDILDFTKIESGKLNISKSNFSLSELTESIRLLQEPKAEEKDIALIIEVDPLVPEELYSDSVRIFQVVMNLVNNAIKFTEKGRVVLDISQRMKNHGRMLIFKVSDTGIGIPHQKLNSIFSSFTQVGASTTRKYGGSGLGLTIAKRLAQMLKGDLEVESTLDKGSTFTFSIPLETIQSTKSHSKDKEEREDTPGLLKDKKALLVEDNVMNQAVAEKYLRDWGVKVIKAMNGKEACLLIEENDVDVVLMDIQMPVMNGLEATQFIRSMEGPKSEVPIIAMTANAFETEKDRCIDAGMNDYLSKPYKPIQLKDKLIHTFKPQAETEKKEKLVSGGEGQATQVTSSNLDYDLRLLANLSGGDEGFFFEMIQTYINSAPPMTEAMEEALLKQDWDMLRKQAHKLKPSVSMMGMNQAQEILTELLQKTDLGHEVYEDRVGKVMGMVRESIGVLKNASYPKD